MPSSLQVSAQAQERVAVFLAMIAGYVDAYGFISDRTYVSFMSGNTTQTGSLIGQGNLAAAVPALLAIVFFFIGVFTQSGGGDSAHGVRDIRLGRSLSQAPSGTHSVDSPSPTFGNVRGRVGLRQQGS